MSGVSEARVVKFCTQAISNISFRMANYHLMDMVSSRDSFLHFGVLMLSLEWVKLGTSNLICN